MLKERSTVTIFLILMMLLFLFDNAANAKTLCDKPDERLQELFLNGKCKYIIRHSHQFSDTLKVPQGSELFFDGGCIVGPIVFDKTKLSGRVNLKGASLKGTVINKIFDASWVCAKDGVSDDAPIINGIIEVCNRVFFPEGRYRLKTAFDATRKVPRGYESSIKTHIGISKSGISLEGTKGTTFITDKPLSIICVFSQPNNIDGNVKDILLQNLTFEVHNNGQQFHEQIHSVKTIGVKGLRIIGCTFIDFWGDAICLGHYQDTPETGERTRNQNVKILNNTIIGGDHHNNRNGISVINGKDVLIKDNTIKNTSRKDMPGGIDVEPNNSAYTIENIRIENNVFEEIRGSGGAICVVAFNEGPAHKVSIVNNRIYNSNNGILLYVKTMGSTEDFIVKGNYVDRNTNPYRFAGSGASKNWTISGNTFDRPCKQNIPGEITVNNLTVKKNKKKD